MEVANGLTKLWSAYKMSFISGMKASLKPITKKSGVHKPMKAGLKPIEKKSGLHKPDESQFEADQEGKWPS